MVPKNSKNFVTHLNQSYTICSNREEPPRTKSITGKALSPKHACPLPQREKKRQYYVCIVLFSVVQSHLANRHFKAIATDFYQASALKDTGVLVIYGNNDLLPNASKRYLWSMRSNDR